MSSGGPPGEHPPIDVLDHGGDGERGLPPAVRRRLLLGSAVVVLCVAAVASGVELQQRRHAAAEERRLAGLLQLSSSGALGIFVLPDPPPSRTAEVEMRIDVHNDGPRDVTLTRASSGGLRLLAPVPLPAQMTQALVMRQRIECDAGAPAPLQIPPGPMAAPGPLQITARTARGTRTITIPRPPYNTDHADLACALMDDPAR